ncbi:MAG: Fe2+-dependent dioxygenase [Pseudomonadota bacterium]|nr:Fe2+-dependent dioxygenase [Pseudomonadota bacterium]
MLTKIPGVLGKRDLEQIRSIVSGARFVDGKLSAGMAAQRVKNNTEMAADESRLEGLNALVMGALVRHPLYQHAALPHRVATPFYARYTPGRSYGDHVDDPVMGSEHRYRSDVSITLFLSAPEDYDGGELIIETSFGNQEVKSPAGDAVLYPSSSRHRVAEVTGGERLVAVTWAQSLVRDAARRELLFELGQARDRLLARSPDASETRQVDKSYVNLLRMWAEL